MHSLVVFFEGVIQFDIGRCFVCLLMQVCVLPCRSKVQALMMPSMTPATLPQVVFYACLREIRCMCTRVLCNRVGAFQGSDQRLVFSLVFAVSCKTYFLVDMSCVCLFGFRLQFIAIRNSVARWNCCLLLCAVVRAFVLDYSAGASCSKPPHHLQTPWRASIHAALIVRTLARQSSTV